MRALLFLYQMSATQAPPPLLARVVHKMIGLRPSKNNFDDPYTLGWALFEFLKILKIAVRLLKDIYSGMPKKGLKKVLVKTQKLQARQIHFRYVASFYQNLKHGLHIFVFRL